jgi:hypothetical protein
MSIPPAIVLALVAVIVAANANLHAVILGQMVTCPVLWLVLAGAVLALAALVLVLVYLIIRDLRPVVRT